MKLSYCLVFREYNHKKKQFENNFVFVQQARFILILLPSGPNYVIKMIFGLLSFTSEKKNQ